MEKSTPSTTELFQVPFLDDKSDDDFDYSHNQDSSSPLRRPIKFNSQARRRIEEYFEEKRLGLELADDIFADTFEDIPTNETLTPQGSQ